MPQQVGPDLKRYMDKKLALKLNGSRHITGKLRGFDQFMNLVLDETVEHVSATERNDIGMVCDKPSRARARAHTHTRQHKTLSRKECEHRVCPHCGCPRLSALEQLLAASCWETSALVLGQLRKQWVWGGGFRGSIPLCPTCGEGLVFPVSVRGSVSLTSPCLYRWSCVATASSPSRPSRNSGTTCHRPTGKRLRPP